MPDTTPATDTPARGRPRLFEPDEALVAAMLTFWRQGYVHTSLDDLVRETGASRGSLYKTFGDKRAMFIQALDLYSRGFEDKAGEAMAHEPEARSVMRVLLTASAMRLSGGEAPAGCLRCNSTLEIGGMDAELDAALADINARYLGVMTSVIRRGAEEGTVQEARVDSLATYFSGIVAGMVSLAKAGATRAALLDNVEIALSVWPDRTSGTSLSPPPLI